MPVRLPRILLLAALAAAPLVGCGDDAVESVAPAPPRAPVVAAPAPAVELTAEDRAVWRNPVTGRHAIPVLLYHGIDEREGFANDADAFYAVRPTEFAKQMALLHHIGYRAITLAQFRRWHDGAPVDLPQHPILITFDDGRADALRHADAVLARYGWTATMFVDVGAVEAGAPEYATWSELAAMQRSGRWTMQLHAGHGHHNIRYGAAEREVGPYYAYRDAPNGETTAAYLRRVTDDLDWGEAQLRKHIPGYVPLGFAPPFGAYGQLGTNDPAIPALFGRALRERFGLVFVQADPHPAVPGEQDVTRLQLDRTTTGGQLHDWLAHG
jgi:peptidoglycan/xylan/chitin deacetylase (PgdA/CDA1 family)